MFLHYSAFIVLHQLASFANPQYVALANRQLQEAPSKEISLRKEQLLKVLQKKRPDGPFPGSISLRAADELAAMKGLVASDAKELLKALKQLCDAQLHFPSDRVAAPLATIGSEAVDPILERLNEKDITEDESHQLLVVLGKMGPAAHRAVPFLHEILEKPGVSSADKTKVRVILANIRGSTKDEAKQLLMDLASAKTAHTIATMLFEIGPSSWTTKEMNTKIKEHLTNIVKDMRQQERPNVELSGGHRLAVALAFTGPSAIIAVDELEELQKLDSAGGPTWAPILGLVIARIDETRGDGALRKGVKALPKVLTQGAAGAYVGFEQLFHRLVDEKTSILIAKMLNDNDEQVSEGAYYALAFAGLSAQKAFPLVVQEFRKCKIPDKRLRLAPVLTMVASFEQLAELEKLASQEESPAVKEALHQAIAEMRHMK